MQTNKDTRIARIQHRIRLPLTTASAQKRRLALDKQLELFNLTTHYIEGPMYNNANGCLAGWLKMLQTCRTYPALMTEDDVDLRVRYDILRVPIIPRETLLSIGSGNCVSSDCSKPLWVKPHMKRPYTFGTVAMFIPSQAVAERLMRWVSRDAIAGGSPHNGSHIDGKIYLGAFGAKILCPPLLGWRHRVYRDATYQKDKQVTSVLHTPLKKKSTFL